MGVCTNLISKGASPDCESPQYEGLEATAWIFNKEDIASVSYSSTDKNVVVSITMKEVTTTTTKKGFHIYSPTTTPFSGTGKEMETADAGNRFLKTISFLAFGDEADFYTEFIDKLKDGKFVVVVEKAHTPSIGAEATKFEIYGLDRGLKATAMSQDLNENAGAWSITMQEAASRSGVFLYKVSSGGSGYEDTRALLEDLTD